jgi:hypothetical protein
MFIILTGKKGNHVHESISPVTPLSAI